MRIIDSTPTPGSNLYSVVCYCGFPFKTTADNRGKVKCPSCRREADIRILVNEWKATPEEKLQRLKEISEKARALYEKWLAVPELERAKGEGKAMAAKLDEYYAEAKLIMGEIAPGRQPNGTAESQSDS